jgi:hypothetical protein
MGLWPCGCHCECQDCCDCITYIPLGAVITENHYSTQCCAYITTGIVAGQGYPATIPIGIQGTWISSSLFNVPIDVDSTCVSSYYIDYYHVDGEPAEHQHLTTTSRSILMTIGTALVEIFLDSDCCPTSIQVHDPDGYLTDPVLEFGPATIEGYFEAGFNNGTGGPYDLVICPDPPRGVCCVDGVSIGEQITQFYCETNGDDINPGTWYEDGTYDPNDPCSGDPFP